MSVVLNIVFGLALSLAALPSVVWAVHDDSTLCADAPEILVDPRQEVTLSPSEFKAARKFQSHQERQKRWEEQQIERNRLEIESKFPGTKVRYLSKGGESLVYSVNYPGEPNRSLVVKVPLPATRDRRVDIAYDNERKIFEEIQKVDPEGGQYVMPLLPAPEISFENRMLKPLVMKLGTGSLRNLLPELGPKTDRQTMLRLWKEMALGVRAVSRANYVHRDIKPANWIFKEESDGTRHLLLTDFGLAKAKGDPPDEESVQGTLTFMSDNQMRGGSPVPADDLHALLTSMREMLIGSEIWKLDPKDPKNHVRLVDVNLWGRYPVLDQLPDTTRQQADPQVVRILEKKYESVEELILHLESALTRP